MEAGEEAFWALSRIVGDGPLDASAGCEVAGWRGAVRRKGGWFLGKANRVSTRDSMSRIQLPRRHAGRPPCRLLLPPALEPATALLGKAICGHSQTADPAPPR
jgi:hypothetical protein